MIVYAVNSPMTHPEKPVRDRAYRRFIRRFPCIGCASRRLIHAAHTGPHGISLKASDYSCVPLCYQCHPEYDRNPKGFAEKRGLDIAALTSMFHSFYRER